MKYSAMIKPPMLKTMETKRYIDMYSLISKVALSACFESRRNLLIISSSAPFALITLEAARFSCIRDVNALFNSLDNLAFSRITGTIFRLTKVIQNAITKIITPNQGEKNKRKIDAKRIQPMTLRGVKTKNCSTAVIVALS